MNQFVRFEALLGKDKIESLKTKKICVFGLGGVGGNVCDSLIRSGIEHITIIDNDDVNESNINRQLVANTKTIGKAKVDVMEEHLKSLNPNVKVIKFKRFYLPEESDFINFKDYDYVIDAIDTVKAKIDIIEKCINQNVKVITALGCGNKMNPTMLEVSDLAKTSYDPLAKVLRRELAKKGIRHVKVVYSKESPIEPKEKELLSSGEKKNVPASSPFVPPVAGIIIASEVIKDLLD